jgi:hypothetical protein
VLIFSTVEQFKVQDVKDKDPEAPAGKPETLKETGWDSPEDKAVTIVLVTEEPTYVDWLPEFVTT